MISSPLKWMGGKSQLAPEIVRKIPVHWTYAEPFAGAMHTLFAKPPSPLEVVNDINGNLINLWLCIRDEYDHLKEYLERIPISESLFYQFAIDLGYSSSGHGRNAIQDREGMPPLKVIDERNASTSGRDGIPTVDVVSAAKYYYLIRCGYNGIVRKGISFSAQPGKKMTITRQDWNAVSTRLKNVVILQRDFRQILKTYDAPESFFYLDPPYLCTLDRSDYYEHNLTRDDHLAFPEILKGLKGKFILSLDNTKEARDLYDGFTIHQVNVKYSDKGELLIMNYDPPDQPFYREDRKGMPSGAREGMPSGSQRYSPNGSRAHYVIPNCPNCSSRNIQKQFLRHTLQKRSPKTGLKMRTYDPSGTLRCMDCEMDFK